MASRKIQEVLRYCEENFEKGNLEHALRCAVSVSIANPDAAEPYAHVTAYRVLLTAANNRTVTGEPDWYAVFGMKRGLSSTSVVRSVDSRCLDIIELLNGERTDFKPALNVYDLLTRGICELKNEGRRRAYDQRSGFPHAN